MCEKSLYFCLFWAFSWKITSLLQIIKICLKWEIVCSNEFLGQESWSIKFIIISMAISTSVLARTCERDKFCLVFFYPMFAAVRGKDREIGSFIIAYKIWSGTNSLGLNNLITLVIPVQNESWKFFNYSSQIRKNVIRKSNVWV